MSRLYRVGTLTYTRGALAVLIFWLFWGDFCFTITETVVPSVMPLKLRSLGAPNTVIALALSTIPGIINTIVNPVVSYRSDRHRGRWGRRIPFIAATLPFLVLSLFGLAFGDRLGHAVRELIGGFAKAVSPNGAALVMLGLMAAAFSFFNVFVNSAFWYLYNDVVPEHLVARVMSWNRMVSLGASGCYSLFIFQHAETHAAAILAGTGILYTIGLGSVCLNVKEGGYPPPPANADGGTGVLSDIVTYGRECLGMAHYWYLFLASSGVAAAYASMMFNIFLYQSLGLTLAQVGRLSFCATVTATVWFPVFGWLADRFHPIRVVIWGLVLQILVLPAFMVWVFWQPPAHTVFWVLLILIAGFGSPFAAMIAMMDPALLMRIFPKERYGQFCSANAMVRSVATIVSGVVVGVWLDFLTRRFGARSGYCGIYVWNLVAYAVALAAAIKLYRSWQRLGGDDGYRPPFPSRTGVNAFTELSIVSAKKRVEGGVLPHENTIASRRSSA